MALIIGEEFRSLIPPMSADSLAQLEANIRELSKEESSTLRSFHEAGHFIVAELLGFQVEFATAGNLDVFPNGVVVSLEPADSSDLDIATRKMGGIAAEKLIFGSDFMSNAGYYDIRQVPPELQEQTLKRATKILSSRLSRLKFIAFKLRQHNVIDGSARPVDIDKILSLYKSLIPRLQDTEPRATAEVRQEKTTI
jgi:hypothetical protein